nr:hypothetical protein Iba_chr04bCG17320 [Ipomoea batatas]
MEDSSIGNGAARIDTGNDNGSVCLDSCSARLGTVVTATVAG